jgi:hypothetical protein
MNKIGKNPLVIVDKINLIKSKSCNLQNFFGIIEEVDNSEIGIFGGAVRDWYLGYHPKDIDIVLNCTEETINRLAKYFKHQRSNFDGYQFNIDGINFDIWRLADSWVFKNTHTIVCWSNLVESVPFNIDAILVKMNGAEYDLGFSDAVLNKQIELNNITNKNSNKFIIYRAMRFKNKYGYSLGSKLQKIVNSYYHNDLLIDSTMKCASPSESSN